MGTTTVQVAEATDASEARRAALTVAAQLGFNDEQAGRVALVATEAATNALRHGGGGELLIGFAERSGVKGAEIIALDKGRGMRDLERSMRDGYSTAGSAGTGLGAIRRLSSEFELYSHPGKGTALLARIFPGAGTRRWEEPEEMDVGGVAIPVRGERECGDAWGFRTDVHGVTIMVADGLGHGPIAAAASRKAVEVFQEAHRNLQLPELMQRIHSALRATRGAAVALARIRTDRQMLCFTGVGNIAGAVLSQGNLKQMVSHPGTAGMEIRRIHEFTYAYPEDALMVMHSDGVVTHWSLDEYAGIEERSSALIAAVIYRDFNRGRDDAAVVVAKRRGEDGSR